MAVHPKKGVMEWWSGMVLQFYSAAVLKAEYWSNGVMEKAGSDS
jgi:hypothetical protein